MSGSRSLKVAAVVAVAPLACALLFTACNESSSSSGTAAGGVKGGAGGAGKLQYPVQVAPLAVRHVQYSVTAPGSIDAFQQVQITSRVAGAVDRVSFTEGQTVTNGQVLATIESDRYQVAVDQAKAQVAKAQAEQHQAEEQLARRNSSNAQHPGLITQEEVATYETAVATAKADVAAAVQAQRVAELNLRDSFVRAPIAGVVQTRTVQTGQYLQAGTVLATILQRDPLLLRFEVQESDAPRLQPGMIATVTLRETPRTYNSKLTLIAGAADPTTRLVPVTGEIDDKDHQYWLRPGAFCEVNVPIGNARDALVVPTISVQPTETGNLAYVIENNVAKARQIQLGMYTPEGGVEVTQGLKVGDQLVVRGVEPLSDNAPVKITDHTTVEAVENADAGAPTPQAAGSGSASVQTTSATAPAPSGSHGGGHGGHGGGGGQGGAP